VGNNAEIADIIHSGFYSFFELNAKVQKNMKE
jgi:hypothetical protein